MNKGIEILLARMDSNPDEFMGVNNKWVNLIESHEDYMTDEDRKALFAKLHELRMDKFTEHVMKKLLAEQEEKTEEFGAYPQSLANSMAQTQQQMCNVLAQSQLYNNAQNQASCTSSLTMGGLLGSVTVPASAYAHSTMSIQDSNQAATRLQLGKQTLTEKTIKKLKALVK